MTKFYENKIFRSVLAIVLAFILATSDSFQFAATVLASNATPGEVIEHTQGATGEETPDKGDEAEPTLQPEVTQAPTAEPTVEITPAPTAEVTPVPTAEAPSQPEVNYDLPIAQRPEFTRGYVQVTAQSINLYGGAEGKKVRATVDGYSVLYVTERDYANDRLAVAFNANGNYKTAWINTTGVVGFSPSDESYVIGKTKDGEHIVYNFERGDGEADIEVFLAPVNGYAVKTEATATPAPTQEPEATEEPVPTQEPALAEDDATAGEAATIGEALAAPALLSFAGIMPFGTSLSPLDTAEAAVNDSVTALSMYVNGATDVLTGIPFTYAVSYQFKVPPTYKLNDTETYKLWENYENIVLSFTLPNEIKLVDPETAGGVVSGSFESDDNGDGTTTYTFKVGDVSLSTANRVYFSAYVDGNGSQVGDDVFNATNLTMDFSVTAEDKVTTSPEFGEKETFTHNVKNNTNLASVTSVAYEKWGLEKNGPIGGKGTFDANGNFVVEYTINVGTYRSDDNGKTFAATITSDENMFTYDRGGRLDFTQFELVDTLPTSASVRVRGTDTAIATLSDLTIKSAEMRYTSGGGTLDYVYDNTAQTLTTNSYKKKQFLKINAGELPIYTSYTVKVTYDAEDFTLLFDDMTYDNTDPSTLEFVVENEAEFTYTAIGQAQDGNSDSAIATGIKVRYPVPLKISKEITAAGVEGAESKYTFDSNWWDFFGRGTDKSVVFDIKDKSGQKPKVYLKSGNTYTPYTGNLFIGPGMDAADSLTPTLKNNNFTIYLYPGEYTISETDVPYFVDFPAESIKTQTATLPVGKTLINGSSTGTDRTTPLLFTNPAKDMGTLKFYKMIEKTSTTLTDGKAGTTLSPYSGAVFGIYSDAECTELYKEVKSSSTGMITQILPEGTYWLKEITTNVLYVSNTDRILKFEVKANKITTVGNVGKDYAAAWEYSVDDNISNLKTVINRYKDAYFGGERIYYKVEKNADGTAKFTETATIGPSIGNVSMTIEKSTNGGTTWTSASSASLKAGVGGVVLPLVDASGNEIIYRVKMGALGSYLDFHPGYDTQTGTEFSAPTVGGTYVTKFHNVYRGHARLYKYFSMLSRNTTTGVVSASHTNRVSMSMAVYPSVGGELQSAAQASGSVSTYLNLNYLPMFKVVDAGLPTEKIMYVEYYAYEAKNATTNASYTPFYMDGGEAVTVPGDGYLSKTPLTLATYETNVIAENTIRNIVNKTYVDLHKIDALKKNEGADIPLAGAKFAVYTKEQYDTALLAASGDVAAAVKALASVTATTTMTSKATVLGEWTLLAPGDYVMVETKAPAGFLLDTTQVRSFTVAPITSYQQMVDAAAIATGTGSLNDLYAKPSVTFKNVETQKLFVDKKLVRTKTQWQDGEDGQQGSNVQVRVDNEAKVKFTLYKLDETTGKLVSYNANIEVDRDGDSGEIAVEPGIYFLDETRLLNTGSDASKGLALPNAAKDMYLNSGIPLAALNMVHNNGSLEYNGVTVVGDNKLYYGPIPVGDPREDDQTPARIDWTAWNLPNVVDITVIKENPEGGKLGKAEFQLRGTATGMTATTVTGETEADTKNSNFGTYTFKDVPLYYNYTSGSGVNQTSTSYPITYTLTETKSPDHFLKTAEIKGLDNEEVLNTYSYTIDPSKVSLKYTMQGGVPTLSAEVNEVTFINQPHVKINVLKWLRDGWLYETSEDTAISDTLLDGIEIALFQKIEDENDPNNGKLKYVAQASSPAATFDSETLAALRYDGTYYVVEVDAKDNAYPDGKQGLPSGYTSMFFDESDMALYNSEGPITWTLNDKSGKVDDPEKNYGILNYIPWVQFQVLKRGYPNGQTPADVNTYLSGAEFTVYQASVEAFKVSPAGAVASATKQGTFTSGATEGTEGASTEVIPGIAYSPILDKGNIYFIEETGNPHNHYGATEVYAYVPKSFTSAEKTALKAALEAKYGADYTVYVDSYNINKVTPEDPHDATFANEEWPPGWSNDVEVEFKLRKVLEKAHEKYDDKGNLESTTYTYEELPGVHFDLLINGTDGETRLPIAELVTGTNAIPSGEGVGIAKYKTYISNLFVDEALDLNGVEQTKDSAGALLEKIDSLDYNDEAKKSMAGEFFTLTRTGEDTAELRATLMYVETETPNSVRPPSVTEFPFEIVFTVARQNVNVNPPDVEAEYRDLAVITGYSFVFPNHPQGTIYQEGTDNEKDYSGLVNDYYTRTAQEASSDILPGNAIVNTRGAGNVITVRKYGYTRNPNYEFTAVTGAQNTVQDWLGENVPTKKRKGLKGVSFGILMEDPLKPGTYPSYAYFDKDGVYVPKEDVAGLIDKPAQILKTNESGYLYFYDLPKGNYRLVEYAGITGYENIMAGGYYQFSITGKGRTISIFNPRYPTIKIAKYNRFGDSVEENDVWGYNDPDDDNKWHGWDGSPASIFRWNTKFDVQTSTSNVLKGTIGFDGTTKVTLNSNLGTWYIYETATHNDYDVSKAYIEPQSFSFVADIDEWPEDNIFAAKSYNARKVSIELKKVSAQSATTPVQGAKFNLYFQEFRAYNAENGDFADLDAQNKEWVTVNATAPTFDATAGGWTLIKVGTGSTAPAKVWETDENGKIKFEGLTPGWYAAVEVEAPENYSMGTEVQVVAAPGDLIYEPGVARDASKVKLNYTFGKDYTNEPYASLRVAKTYDKAFAEEGQYIYVSRITFDLYVMEAQEDGEEPKLVRFLDEKDKPVSLTIDSINEEGKGQSEALRVPAGVTYYILEQDIPGWVNTTAGLTEIDGKLYYEVEATYNENAAPTDISFVNTFNKAWAKFFKNDYETKEAYEGAVFQAYTLKTVNGVETKQYILGSDSKPAQYTSNIDGEFTIEITFDPRSDYYNDEGLQVYIEEVDTGNPGYALPENPIAHLAVKPGQTYTYNKDTGDLVIENKKGLVIKIEKYGNIKSVIDEEIAKINANDQLAPEEKQDAIAKLRMPGAEFALYKVYTDGAKTGTTEFVTSVLADENGIVSFSSLEIPKDFVYAVYELAFASDSPYYGYSLDNIYYTGESAPVETQSVTISGAAQTVHLTSEALEASTTYTYQAYNLPTAGVEIRKYAEGSTTDAVPLATFNIYALAKNAEGKDILGEKMNSALLQSTLANGDGTTYSAVTLPGLLPGKYVAVEMGSTWPMVLDDTRIEPLQYFEIEEGVTSLVVSFKNVQLNVEEDITKESDSVVSHSLLYQADIEKGNEKISFTVGGLGGTEEGVRGGNDVPYASYVLEDIGLTYYDVDPEAGGQPLAPASKYTENLYSIDKLTIGSAAYTNYVKGSSQADGATVTDIYADITLYDFGGNEYTLTGIKLDSAYTLDVQKYLKDSPDVTYPVDGKIFIKRYSIEYYDPILRADVLIGAEEAQKPKYSLGQNFGANDIVMEVTLEQQLCQDDISAVLFIKNDVKLTTESYLYSTTAHLNEGAELVFEDGKIVNTGNMQPTTNKLDEPNVVTADAVVPVMEPDPLPWVKLEKNSSATESTKIGDTFEYSLTLTNIQRYDEENEPMNLYMTNPVLIDQIPKGLEIVANSISYEWTNNDGSDSVITGIDDTRVSEAIDSGEKYIAVWLRGKLAAGDQLVLKFKVTITDQILLYGSYAKNNAWASSADTSPIWKNNKNGASFKQDEGADTLTGTNLDKMFFDNNPNGYVAATVDNYFTGNSASLMSKLVNADESAGWIDRGEAGIEDGYFYGSEATTTASLGGMIRYKMVYSNMEVQFPAEGVRILDIFPKAGDKNASKWTPIFSGISTMKYVDADGKVKTFARGTDYKIYTSTQSMLGKEDTVTQALHAATGLDAALSTHGFGEYTGSISSMPADTTAVFFVFNVKVAKEEKIIITMEFDAPEVADVNPNQYFTLALNEASVSAATYAGRDEPATTPAVKVTLAAKRVGLSGRIWIDKNMDGIQGDTQDLLVDALPTGVKVTLIMRDSNNAVIGTREAFTDANGVYSFTDLPSSKPDSGSYSSLYSGAGGTLNPKALSPGATIYQLSIDAPRGFSVTEPYQGTANTDGLYSWNMENSWETIFGKTSADATEMNARLATAKADSNFTADGKTAQVGSGTLGTHMSEPFFLWSNDTNDNTKDMGLVRERTLTINKEDDQGSPIADATFSVYGPFADATAAQGATLSSANLVGTFSSDEDGLAQFKQSDAWKYLNFYAYYILVETGAGVDEDGNAVYTTEGATATYDEGTLTAISGGVTIDSETYTAAWLLEAGNEEEYEALSGASGVAPTVIGIVNEFRVGNLVIEKQDASSATTKLSGAQYTIAFSSENTISNYVYLTYLSKVEADVAAGKSTLEDWGIASISSGVITTLATGADGRVTVKNLPDGLYTVTEIVAPVGYVLRDATEDATANQKTGTVDSSVETPVALVFTNNKIILTLNKISEVAAANGDASALENVVFTLYKQGEDTPYTKNSVAGTLTTNAGGVATSSVVLENGIYELYETAPSAFYTNGRYTEVAGKGWLIATFSVNNASQTEYVYSLTGAASNFDGDDEGDDGDGYYTSSGAVANLVAGTPETMIVNTIAKGALSIAKEDEYGNRLADVVFELTMDNSNTAEAKAAFAQYKKFIFEQLLSSTPNNWEKGTRETTNGAKIGTTMGYANIDSASGTLKVKTDDGNEIGLIRVAGLPVGDYTLTEVSVPYGIVTPTAHVYTFSITQNGDEVRPQKDDPENPGTLIDANPIVNEIIKVSLTMQKKDAATGALLGGSQFVVSHVNTDGDDGTQWTRYLTMLSKLDENSTPTLASYGVESVNVTEGTLKTLETAATGANQGKITVTGMPIGQYTAEEVVAPTGYVLNDTTDNADANKDTSVLLTATVTTDTLEYTNNKIFVELRKVSEIGAKKLGVTFNVYKDGEDNIFETLTTNATTGYIKSSAAYTSGTYKIYEVLPSTGDYVRKELAAPDAEEDTNLGILVATFTVTATQTNWVYSMTEATEASDPSEDGYYPIAGKQALTATTIASGVVQNPNWEIVNKIATGTLNLTKLDEIDNPVADVEFKLEMTSGDADAFALYVAFVNSKLADISTWPAYGTQTTTGWSNASEDTVNDTSIGIETADVDGTDTPMGFVMASATELRIRTDELGKVILTGLPKGEYLLTEVAVPAGIKLADEGTPLTESFEITEEGYVAQVSIDNERALGRLDITKQDADTDAYLSGAQYVITYLDTNSADQKKVWTSHIAYLLENTDLWEDMGIASVDGTAKSITTLTTSQTVTADNAIGHRLVKDLPAGEYAVRETVAPTGYVLKATDAENTKTVTVAATAQAATAQFKNKRIFVELNKVSEITRSSMTGVAFNIYKQGESAIHETITTGSTGAAKTTAVYPAGTYEVYEVLPTAGYVVQPGLTNDATKGILVATFTVTAGQINWAYRLTALSTEKAGETGYFKTQGVQTVAATTEAEDAANIATEIVNKIVTGSLTITKTDDNDKPVAGVEFELTMSSGNTAAFAQYKAYVKEQLTATANSWSYANKTTVNGTLIGVTGTKGFIQSTGAKLMLKTDVNGEVTIAGLPAGTYTLTETKVPYGFKATSSATITSDNNVIADDGDVMNYTVENLIARGTITVAKKSVETMPEGGNEIIFDVGVNPWEPPIDIPLGRASNPKYWIAKDTGAVTGTATFGAGAQFKITQVTNHVVGTENPWEILVESYANATGSIVREDDNTLIVTTGADGKIQLPNVPYGEYKVTEIKAPIGHALPTDNAQVRSITVIIGDPQEDTYAKDSENWGLTANDPFIKVQVTKVDSTIAADAEPVVGAQFQILSDPDDSTTALKKPNGSPITLTTNASGVAISGEALPFAEDTDYYLVETLTPYGYDTVANHKISKADIEAMRTQSETVYDLTTNTTATYPSDAANLVDPVSVGSLEITKLPDYSGMTMDVVQPAQFRLTKVSTAVDTSWKYFIAKLTSKNIVPTNGTIEKVSDNVWTITVDADGKFKLENIPYGVYTIEEIAAPTGYALPLAEADRKVTVTIGDKTNPQAPTSVKNDAKAAIAQELTFTDPHLRLYIEKLDENGEAVVGATFALFSGSTKIANSEMVTDIDGEANTYGKHLPLVAGTTYTLKELVPYGYIGHDVDNPTTTWVDAQDTEGNTITITPSRTQTVYEYRLTGEGTASTSTVHYGKKLNNFVARGDLTIDTMDSRNGEQITTFTGTEYNMAEYVLSAETTEATKAFHYFAQTLDAADIIKGRSLPVAKSVVQTKGRMTIEEKDGDGLITAIRLYTDASGEIDINGLPFGEYTLEEVDSSTGYVLDDPNLVRTFTVGTKVGAVLLADETYYNTPYEVQLYKASDLEDLRGVDFPLPGAKFEIRTDLSLDDADQSSSLQDKDGNVIVLTSGKNGLASTAQGEIVLPLLLQKTYYLVETYVPNGYELLHEADQETFEIENRQIAKYLIDYTRDTGLDTMYYDYGKIVNELSAVPLTIRKQDAQNSSPLAGAQFTLTGTAVAEGTWESYVGAYVETAEVKRGADGRSLIITTPASGQVTLDYIPLGTYTLTETLAPVGYAIDTRSKTIELTKATDVTVGEMVTFTDTRLQLVVEKVNNYGALLPGAVFEVRTDPNNASTAVANSQMVTAENGVARTTGVLNLLPGVTYYLVETYVPDYHAASFKPYAFTVERTWTNYRIDFSSVVPTNDNRLALNEGEIVNDVALGSITIYKRSSVDESLLSGAVFSLRQLSAAAPDAKMSAKTETTGANGRIVFKNLPYGVYQVTEMRAPAGYQMEEYTWTVFVGVQQTSGSDFRAYPSPADAARNAICTITAYNTPVTDGSLRIRKIDGRDGYALEGAEFTLVGTGADGTKIDLKETSDKDGIVLFEDLPGGTYRLTETKTPSEEYIAVQYDVTITSNHMLDIVVRNYTAEDDGVLGALYEYGEEETGVLPVTGEDDLPIGMFAGIGGMVALLGVILLIVKRRRKEQGAN